MLETIQKMLREYKGDDSLTVTSSTEFKELGLDSLDLVELVMNIEEEFNISIEMNEPINTVDDLIKRVESTRQ